MTTEYELPPNPITPMLASLIDKSGGYGLADTIWQLMHKFAIQAIEADRKRRGEPVAFAKNGVLFWNGEHASWRGFDGDLYLSPQPAEPEPCFCDRMYPDSNPDASCGDCPTRDYKKTAEPVKVPRGFPASFFADADELADQINELLREVANGDRKPEKMPIVPIMRAAATIKAVVSRYGNNPGAAHE